MRGQEEVLVQKSRRIVLFSFSKENFKEVPAGRDIFYTNFDVIKLKEKVTPRIKILKSKPNAKTKQKKTAAMKKLLELLLHVLPSACKYQYVSKEAEKPPAKYIVLQRQARAPSAALPLASSKVS